MNKSYRSVWNHALGSWVAVSEIDRGRSGAARTALVAIVAAIGALSAGAQTIDYADGEVRTAGVVTSAGTTTLNISGATAQAAQAGVISGAGGIAKNGAGALVLGTPNPSSPVSGAAVVNTFSGGTLLNGGSLEATSNGSLGTGALTINGGTLRGGVTLANDIVVNGNFSVDPLETDLAPQRGLTLNGNISLQTNATIRFAPPSSVAYLLRVGGVVSGNQGLTIEAPTSTVYWGDLDFVGNRSNTYTGLTTVRGSTVLGLLRTEGATAIAGDLLGQGNSTIVIGQNEQIANTSTVTIDSVSGPTIGGLQLPGLLFMAPNLTETVGALFGSGTINLGSSTLRTGAGDFSGTIADSGIPGIAADGRMVKYGAGIFTLSGANTYSGGTSVEGGTLRVANDGALGTGGLTLAGGTTLDYDTRSTTQISNAITLTGNATLNVDAFGVRQSGAISESASGSRITKSGAGALELVTANSYTGGTDLQQGFIDMRATGALGSGLVAIAVGTTTRSTGLRVGDNVSLAAMTVANAGFVDVSQATTGTAIGSLDGNGDVLLGARTLTLGGLNVDNAIGGAIQDGGVAGGAGGSIVKTGIGTLTLSGANSYTGATTVASGTLRTAHVDTLSAASAHTVARGATLDLAGYSQTVASLDNGGTVSLLSARPGADLTVTGAYVGRGGTLALGTTLNATGPSDRLVLDGASASASGNTTVRITNIGGLGALTTGNGIEVVAARNGATTTAQTTKSAFTLAGGHVDAGAYAYTLHAADASSAGESWYLRSDAPAANPAGTTTTATPAPAPASPTTAAPATSLSSTTSVAPTTIASATATTAASAVSAAPVAPTAIAAVPVPNYRTEVPLMAALPQQLRQADLAMLGNLHQRIGDTPAGMASVTAGAATRTAWGRVISTSIDARQQGTVAPESKGRVTGFQAGTDLFANANWHAGVYVGQLDGDVNASGFANGTWAPVGRNDLRARYVGGYATWTGDSGIYADAVLQAGDHRYSVHPLGNASVSGKGDSLLASIEAGKSFALSPNWKIEPQVQLIHQRIDLDDVIISGARVQQNSDNGWIARVGVRVKGEVSTALGTLQPYGRVNLYRASSGADIARFVGPAASTDISTRTGGSSAELAGGFTLAIGRTWSVYGEVGRLYATGGEARVRSAVQGSVGVKARW
ncbi:autotransporter outer membrane beta-barrel domain-containing protein [Variovorax sp. RHLX14]|uniref:autotransporter outer membrane beta-barrel domain-containing protein n=1 Tax=Variovorax sp. RHLX14 TaxID=1259731 RepID=UPI003F470E58